MNKQALAGLALLALTTILATACGGGESGAAPANTPAAIPAATVPNPGRSDQLGRAAQARVEAYLRQHLAAAPAAGQPAAAALGAAVAAWYGSGLAPAVKLTPDGELCFKVAGELLQEGRSALGMVAANQYLTAAAKIRLTARYEKLAADCAANLRRLSDLAAAPSGLPEPAQQTLVAAVAADQIAAQRLLRALEKDARATMLAAYEHRRR